MAWIKKKPLTLPKRNFFTKDELIEALEGLGLRAHEISVEGSGTATHNRRKAKGNSHES
ncbi:hypothetical protein SAMN05660745_01510 [Corynebacterium glucuronolyticum]|nr:hypothetical protein CGLUCO_03700 [Corynebacterium glucuronolyticum DSM 44120]SMB85686.1 hypothetical protein SAMN05660745_01510 [Corynebacterium glucuronolyticum]